MGFLSPLPPWYLPCGLGVDIGGSGSQRGETLCIASLVLARCACSGSYSPSPYSSRPASLGNRCAPPWSIEGATQTWRVTDKDGKIVEVHVPAQSLIDIQTSQEERPGASGAAEPVRGTVPATVVAVDTLTNRVKVQTQAGQVIELATATTDRQIGEQVTLIIPR